MNNKIKGIVIDAGHGGSDQGAVGNGIIEKDLNLKISKYIYDRLNDLGINAKLTRDSDETLTPAERVNKVLNAFGNSSDVLVISNHINSGGGDGAEIIYALRNNDTLSKLILKELEKEGQNTRKAFQKRLPSNPSKDYYFMHRNTGNTEPIIIEYGFLDSKGDDVNQLKNNWQNYAEAVVRALTEYLNLEYIPINQTEYYTVKTGDTLWSIAKKYGISVNDLKNKNGINNSKLSIGQQLLIPVRQEENPSQNIYTIKKGDTLYSIANEFDTTPADIIQSNNLTSTILSIGQKLNIPSKIQDEKNTYIVNKGDTLYNIAKKFNADINKIKEINNLSNDILSIGQQLIIPSSQATYIVKSGDTLYSIAKRFNKTIDELRELNNITNNILNIGQLIKLV